MTPPELTAYAPVLDVLQPVAVCVLVLGRIELEFIIHNRRQSHIGKVLHLEEPLHGELGLNNSVRVALAVAHLVGVVLHLFQQACVIQVNGNLLLYGKTVHTDVQAGLLAQSAVVVEYVDGLKVVLFTQHIVIDIMGRGNLKATGTELNVNIIILNYRYHAVNQRHNHLVALQPAVLGIGRVDAHGGITHDGLGTCGGNHCVVALGILVYHLTLSTCGLYRVLGGIGHVVFQVVQLAVLLLIDHLLITQSSLSLGVPVYHTYATVDKTLVVQVNEHLDNTLRAQVIHGECGAVPVTAAAQTAELLKDYASVLLFPLPCVLKELLTGQISFLDALCGKLAYNLGLGSN